MSKTHTVSMSQKAYPGGLRFFECRECAYAFAAEVNEVGVLEYATKITVNHGDLEAAHSYFFIPDEVPTLSISATYSQDDDEM
ncbi:hypothetical protein [Candidatus Leptofilum sp.]|uniref:hypothetical protein n=1 Tax=Candidatus Leptofilum sp. TaxID=3241576 RepID=UPI003B5BB356